MLRLYLYARVRFPCAQLHTRPRVQRAPGLPCALPFQEGQRCKTRAKDVARKKSCIDSSLRAQRRNPCLNAGKDGLLPPSLSELRRTSRCARNDVEGPQRTGCAPSARVTAASGAAHCLHNTIFSCNAFIEQRGGQSGITMCSFGTQIAALDSTNYFCWSTGDCNDDDLFSTHEEPTDRLDSRSRTKDKVRDGEEIAWVNFLAR